MAKVVIVTFTAQGEMVEGDYADGIIGNAGTLESAKELAASKGYALVDFRHPDHIPGELIGEQSDAFAVGVYA